MTKTQVLSTILLSLVTLHSVYGRQPGFCVGKGNAFLADPDDCTSFYKCFLSNAFHFACPVGLHYNEEYTVCDWPGKVACGQRGIPTEPPTTLSTTPSPTTTPSTTVERSSAINAVQTPFPLYATFCQTRANALFSDPEDCSGYYQCHNGASYHFTCPLDLVFNQDRQYCDWTWNVNCLVPTRKMIQTQISSGSNQTGTEGKTATVNNYQAQDCGNVVCYIPNWAIYRLGDDARFGPEDVNPQLCTHIIYAFANLLGNRLVASDSNDEPRGRDIGNFARAANLKLQNPKLKILLAIGGWNMDSSLFSNMAANEKSREEFISTTISFLRQINFDGLSLDWRGSGLESPDLYKVRYATLCEELRRSFDNEASGDKRLILSGAVSGAKNVIDTFYDISKLAASLDIINVMSYDLHGTWEGRTGHGSPLKASPWENAADAHLNVEWVANYWASLGAPKNKLVLGAPLYARTFILSSPLNVAVGAPINGPGSPGRYTAESGYMAYYEVCSMMEYSTKYFTESQRVPYLVSKNQWVGYEDPSSLSEKMRFIQENGFGGIMVWDLSMDDFSGAFCGQGKFPLMKAILSQCVPSVAGG